MMNKTAIDWCDFTWNPITGCPKGCPYCYARRQANRFSGDVRLNLSGNQITTDPEHPGSYILEQPFKTENNRTLLFPTGFATTFHRYRLPMPAQKKKPASIFVCSMGDLFSPAIPTAWIAEVFGACHAAPWHKYLFLTKYPRRYSELKASGDLPTDNNFWFGTTATGPWDIDRVNLLPEGVHRFVSIEPLQGDVVPGLHLSPQHNPAGPAYITAPVDWVIVGAETGRRAGKITPRREWLEAIVNECQENDVPFLLKDSEEMRTVWGDAIPQMFPDGLEPMPQDNSIPHCKGCDQAQVEQQGRRGEKIVCKATGQHAKGRYTRSSPAWCPKRKEPKA